MKSQDTATRQKVFVGLSGGVDSSVAAALLKERGFDVHGVYMKNWADPDWPCPWQEERKDAMRVAADLGIPFATWDFTKEYRAAVVDYMVREYAAGRTPNPDVMCNREIKFGVFLKRTLAEGADFVATGHYVRKTERGGWKMESGDDTESKNNIPQPTFYSLHISRDTNKDQSYFLWTLTRKQLRHCLFPIGEYTKPEVRALAKKFGLHTADKKDSQGICFIGKIDLADFLRKEIGVRRGLVKTTAGAIIGEHDGVGLYTVGQRKGIGIGGGTPYYVSEKNPETNTLVVADTRDDSPLYQQTLAATDISWISKAPALPLSCEARIRYRQPLQKCTVTFLKAKSYQLKAVFAAPQRAISPGQSVVFYRDGEVLGGGTIERAS